VRPQPCPSCPRNHLWWCRYAGDPSSRSGDDGYVSKGAFGKQSRLSKQKHQITAVAMDLMLNEKEILAVSSQLVF
jgi:hypothetical protein